jgi:hypothetical protein
LVDHLVPVQQEGTEPGGEEQHNGAKEEGP